MKLKSLIFIVFLGLFTNSFATNMHLHPKAENTDKKEITKKLTYPGFCEIEIINDSFSDLRVSGTFDDGTGLDFYIYRYEAPHYISLFYYGYCHSGMYLTVQTPFYTVYSDWTNAYDSIRVVPYLKNKIKAEVSTR